MTEQYNPKKSFDLPDASREQYVWQPDDSQESALGVSGDGGHLLPKKNRGQVSARTLIAPLTLMIFHHLMLNGASLAYMLAFLVRNPELKAELLEKANDQAFLLEVMIQANVVTYASLFSMLILIPLYLGYLFMVRKKGTSLMLRERVTATQALSATAVMLGAMGLTQLWMVVLSSLDEMSWLGRLFQEYLDKMALFDGRTSTQMLDLLVTVLLVPVAEELLFRGIIQGELRRAFGPIVSVVATAVLFAVFHLDVIQGSYVLIAGLALSIVYHFTENIMVPIGLHVLFNFIGSGWLSRLLGVGETGEAIIVYVLYASIILGFGAIFILRKKHKEKATLSSERMVS